MLLVCECLSGSVITIAGDDNADVRHESCVLVEDGKAVAFRVFPCGSSVSYFSFIKNSYVQCIARALTKALKWTPKRKMHPTMCSILRAIA